MPKFSEKSLERLETCDTNLQILFKRVVKKFDCSILCGYRDSTEQNRAFREKRSKLQYPDSNHNQYPSKAVDVAPYYSDGTKIRWNDKESFVLFGGYVLGLAEGIGIKIRWGGDWNSNKDTHDQKFNDLVHFEIVD